MRQLGYRSSCGSTGATLIELIVAITIIAAVGSTLIGVLSATSTRSAESVVQTQAVTIANAYLTEILAKPFFGTNPGVQTRATYDDVRDYDGLTNVGPRTQFDAPVVGLAGYQVGVRVVATNVQATPGRLVIVTVTAPTGAITVMSGYKTLHP